MGQVGIMNYTEYDVEIHWMEINEVIKCDETEDMIEFFTEVVDNWVHMNI